MLNIEVKSIDIPSAITAIGKICTGDYNHSPQYISEVQNLLNQQSISFFPNKVMGIYYDNPMEKRTEELKSFQGLFPMEKIASVAHPLIEVSLEGRYLYTKVSGDPVKSIYDGYAALFDYIQKNNITLRSTAGYQVSTFENQKVSTEIYMQQL